MTDKRPICIIPNCRKTTPASEPFCADHRDEPMAKMAANYWKQDWHEKVLLLCLEHGFGAVMQSASRQWQMRDPIGALSLGPCFGSIKDTDHDQE